MEIKLTQKQKELIEEYGVFSERSGVSPAQARILALLLICDAAELTFDDIYQTLKISKSAASNAINSLLIMERLEYTTKPGDRRRYFKSTVARVEGDFDKKLTKLLQINNVFKAILANRSKVNKEFNADLQKVISFMDFLESEMPEVYKKWRRLNK
jgi:DNA-binding transcriptional regulator GbsR (MarR family)